MKAKLVVSLFAVVCMLTLVVSSAQAERIVRFADGFAFDLVPGAERGTVTFPMFQGTIASTGATVYFTITDVSDGGFAGLVGAMHAANLDKAFDAGVETAVFDDGPVVDGRGTWTFMNDAGTVSYIDGTGTVVRPVANGNYSPLKRFAWDGKVVTANMPFIQWGNGPGQQLIIDGGGCDPLIRSNPPSPFFVGSGPTDGADCTNELPLDRYKGGQITGIDFAAMTVTFKLHKGTFREKRLPYYFVTDASKLPAAEYMGVIHAPKAANLGRAEDSKAVGNIFQFANGVRVDAGGPNRYQSGIVDYPNGSGRQYTPMWHIIWLFYDCDGDGIFFAEDRNIAFGAVPVEGSGIPGFDPADPATFDPFGMDDKGVDCPAFAIAVTGDPDGFAYYKDETALIRDGVMIGTEGPGGLPLNSPLQPPLIVNCPVPLQVRL